MIERLPLRRLAAYLLDYVIMAAWIGLLIYINTRGGVPDMPGILSSAERWRLQGLGFVSLTLPVWAYFTLCESSGWKATLGKKVMGLKVSGSFFNVAFRNALKFLPWELAHTAIWHGMETPLASPPNMIALVTLFISLILITFFAFSLFVRSGRTPYDLLSKTFVYREKTA